MGKIIPECIDEIGYGIDFVLLDTAHSLPGEVLDFLVILPFLKDGAVVCLHDISFNHAKYASKDGIATNVLMNSVAGEKIIYRDKDSGMAGTEYPNIGAFIVTEDTRKYVINVFGILTLNWNLILEDDEYEIYKNFLELKYDKSLTWFFDKAHELNTISLKYRPNKLNAYQRLRKMGKILLRGYC